MEPTIKPGTRCECRSEDCAQAGFDSKDYRHIAEKPHNLCGRAAVRMVTVRVGERKASARPETVPASEWESGIYKLVPMCEPCATFHESKEAAS